MKFSRKDLGVTIVILAALGAYLPFAFGNPLPLLSGPRVLTAVLLVLGMIGCSFGSSTELREFPRVYATTASIIGVIALAAGLFALVSGSAVSIGILVGCLVLLWAGVLLRKAYLAPWMKERSRHNHVGAR